MKLLTASILTMFALGISAQTTKAPVPPPPTKAPVISDALRAEFFKKQLLTVQANEQSKQRQTEFESVIDQMRKSCGDSYTVQLNTAGDPECIVKPAAKK